MKSQALLNQEMNSKKVEIISFITHLDKKKIEAGLLDIEEGKIVTNETVMKKAQEKLDNRSDLNLIIFELEKF